MFQKHCPDWVRDYRMFTEFKALYHKVKVQTKVRGIESNAARKS